MVDINLHQAAEKDLLKSRQKSIFNSTYVLSFVLLAVVGGLYGITMFYKNVLVAKQARLLVTKETEMKSIDGEEINRLSDFESRLNGVVFNLENKKNPEDLFQLVERLIVKGSFLDSLVYDSVEDKIEIEVVADSFRLAANQILSLKKSDLFSDVQIVDSSRNQDGQAVFKLSATFKSNIKS